MKWGANCTLCYKLAAIANNKSLTCITENAESHGNLNFQL